MLLLAIVLVAFVVPWFPTVNNRGVKRTFTDAYTDSYQLTTQGYQTQTIYTVPNPVMLPASTSEIVQELSLQEGSIVHVQLNSCDSCVMLIAPTFSNTAGAYLTGSSTSGSFTPMTTGRYAIDLDNTGKTDGQFSSIVLTADVPQTVVRTVIKSNTQYNIVTDTQYAVSASPPYAVFGVLTSVIVIMVVALIVAVVFLFGQRRIRTATNAEGGRPNV